MPDRFEITHKDVFGRIGKLDTPHGHIETPALLPVVNLNLMLIAPSEMRQFGAEALMTNAYIIYRSTRLREAALSGGIHSLLGFDGPIMTDSGSFQLATYGDIEIHSEEIVAFQRDVGSDIGTPIDIPTPPDVAHHRALRELDVTLERIQEATRCCGTDMLLAAPIQGSTHLDLRERYAGLLSKLSADVYPIGAVVPLMESYRYADLSNVIMACKTGLALNKPVHLFGAGHPMMFALAVALGCDLFDSAAYALYARDGRYMTPRGTHKLKDLTYLPCACPVCSSGDRKLTERELAEGDRWHRGTLTVAQEHMTSAILRNLLGGLVRLYAPSDPPVRILFATPSGELHEFGVLAAAMLAAARGFEALYLGPNLPAREIVAAAKRTSSQAVVLGIKASKPAPETMEEVKLTARALPERMELWLGGGDARNALRAVRGARVFALKDFEELGAHLGRLREGGR